jgi:pimeloyl-ACP methyl ester carboxylesterase
MIAGFSMGGGGAWNIAIAHPELFSSAWVCCPGAWDQNGLRDTLSGWDSTYRNAYGAAYSPDFALPSPYAAFPKFDGTYADSIIMDKWERGFGGIGEKLAAYGKKTAKLKAISFVYGNRDGYGWIPRGTQYIAEKMRVAGLPVEIRAFKANHAITDEMLSESFLPLARSVFGDGDMK